MRVQILDLIAPPRCAACGARAPLPWCDDCRAAARIRERRGGCARCSGVCGPDDPACPFTASPIEATVAAFTYTGVIARTVVAAKVGGHHAAWRPLGAHLGSRCAKWSASIDAVVAVPTEPGRARRRGFDHTAILAEQVGRVLDRPVVAALRLRRHTPDRGRGARSSELAAGAVRPVRSLAGVGVLLVDDVLTTGATLRAAAAALRRADASRVRVAVLARAGG